MGTMGIKSVTLTEKADTAMVQGICFTAFGA